MHKVCTGPSSSHIAALVTISLIMHLYELFTCPCNRSGVHVGMCKTLSPRLPPWRHATHHSKSLYKTIFKPHSVAVPVTMSFIMHLYELFTCIASFLVHFCVVVEHVTQKGTRFGAIAIPLVKLVVYNGLVCASFYAHCAVKGEKALPSAPYYFQKPYSECRPLQKRRPEVAHRPTDNDIF